MEKTNRELIGKVVSSVNNKTITVQTVNTLLPVVVNITAIMRKEVK